MANDRIFLSNDAVGGGIDFNEATFYFGFASESSAAGTASATLVPLFVAPENGRIVDCFVGVVLPAVSASGFVSGTQEANVRINSVQILSTVPAINMAGSAGQAVRKSTNAGGGVSAVVNWGSATFSAGDQISIDYNSRSVGSAAAGAAGKGLQVGVKVRYSAR